MTFKIIRGGRGSSYLISSIPSLVSPKGGTNRLGDVDV